MGDHILMDPLRGETFMLSSYISSSLASVFQKVSRASVASNEYTIAMSRVLVGPPPESVAVIGPHTADSMVIVANLPVSITDAQLKKECIELLSRPRFIYMHVGDLKSGTFSGTAVIEFPDKESAAKAVSVGVAGGRARYVNEQEFISLTSGAWPMLEYGPAQGVFQSQPKPSVPVAVAPSWAQRGPVTNPWQK